MAEQDRVPQQVSLRARAAAGPGDQGGAHRAAPADTEPVTGAPTADPGAAQQDPQSWPDPVAAQWQSFAADPVLADPGEAAVTVDDGGEEVERPLGGIDLLYYPDDPSDMLLVFELGDGQVVSAPLTEMKAARLRQALTNQADAAAFMRHELAGGTIDNFAAPSAEPDAGRYGDDFVDVEAPLDDEDDEDDPDDGEPSGVLGRLGDKARAVANPDPFAMSGVVEEFVEKDVKGISIKYIIVGIAILSFVLAIVSWIAT